MLCRFSSSKLSRRRGLRVVLPVLLLRYTLCFVLGAIKVIYLIHGLQYPRSLPPISRHLNTTPMCERESSLTDFGECTSHEVSTPTLKGWISTNNACCQPREAAAQIITTASRHRQPISRFEHDHATSYESHMPFVMGYLVDTAKSHHVPLTTVDTLSGTLAKRALTYYSYCDLRNMFALRRVVAVSHASVSMQ